MVRVSQGSRSSLAWQNLLITKHGWEPGSHNRVRGGFFGREAVAILHSARPHGRNVVMPYNGVELAQVILDFLWAAPVQADTPCSALDILTSALGSQLRGLFHPATWSDSSFMRNGALDTTMLSTKLLLTVFYCWKFRFSDLKLGIKLNWRLELGGL